MKLDLSRSSSEQTPPITSNNGIHVFLSYSRKDPVESATIRNALEMAGYTVWQDTTAIRGGAEWINSISNGIRAADVVITITSQNSSVSKWVTLEFLEAQRRGKRIIPIRIDDFEIPIIMLDLHVIQAYPDLPLGIKSLLKILPDLDSSPSAHTKNSVSEIRREELDYLDRIIFEFRAWQTVYTPMAGVAQLRQVTKKDDIRRSAVNIDPRFWTLQRQIQKSFSKSTQLAPQEVEDIVELLHDARQIVILGEPGAGKTTTLWKLALDLAEKAVQDPKAPLPVFVTLGALSPSTSILCQIQSQIGNISFRRLLTQRRIAFLIDALNELPAESQPSTIKTLRKLVKFIARFASNKDGSTIIFVATCRELDYREKLTLEITEQVRIAPLDTVRIRQFCINYLPEDGENLFWELLGEESYDVQSSWRLWKGTTNLDFSDMWLNSGYPIIATVEDIMTEKSNSRSMLVLARNPYMLYMMTEVYSETLKLPKNRGKLFELFTNFLLFEREKISPDIVEELKRRLALLSFTMQKERTGTSVSKTKVDEFLPPDLLYIALSANILSGNDEIRFSHQLLQEYFAALKLDLEMRAGTAATDFWPSTSWWQSQGWEETVILLAGLYNDDLSPVIDWLYLSQPELTARCINESEAFTSPASVEMLGHHWRPLLSDSNLPSPAKCALGRALALLGQDRRSGISTLANGLPEIIWLTIPPGHYEIGGDPIAHDSFIRQTVQCPIGFRLSKFLVTYDQFNAFILDDNGINDDRWWQGLALERQPISQQRFKFGNHPRENVSWYQAVAFCRWLTAEYRRFGMLPTNCEILLPTEQQWEIAARLPGQQFYPWGATYIEDAANLGQIGMTSPVGVYQRGLNPMTGVADLSGNVWEWCLNLYYEPDIISLQGKERRALRGGSWINKTTKYLRSASRNHCVPTVAMDHIGFRVCMIDRNALNKSSP